MYSEGYIIVKKEITAVNKLKNYKANLIEMPSMHKKEIGKLLWTKGRLLTKHGILDMLTRIIPENSAMTF